MVYLAISRDNQTPPIQQTDPDRRAAVLEVRRRAQAGRGGDDRRRGSRPSGREPARHPAGEYWVQPFVNVYTRFPRADGHTVWMHMDQWEGQNWKRSPGQSLRRSGEGAHRSGVDHADPLVADKVIPPITVAGRHRHGQADQDPEPDPDEVVGTADLSRRDDPAAQGLRQASRRALSGQLHPGALLAAARPAASAAAASSTSSGSPTTRRGSSTSRCSTRRRITTTPTA